MADISFQTWRENHSFIEDHLHFPDGEDSGWGRVHAQWHEKKNGIDLTHICAFTLDLQSGHIYLDCTKRKIWTKCLFLSVGRPLFGTFKTVYHLILPFSIPFEIFKTIFVGIYDGHSASSIAKNSAISAIRNVADIFRTPLYSTVLTIVVLSGVIIGPFAPRKLYDIRALAGRLESTLNWGEERWTLAPCFQPIANITTIDTMNYIKDDTEYDQEDALKGLNNLARSYVRFRRMNRNPFDDYCRLVPKKGSYVSPAA